MKKTGIGLLLLICAMMLSCCAPKVVLQDDLGSKEMDSQIAMSIVRAFNACNMMIDFGAQDEVPYERIFPYFSYAGMHDADGQIREQLAQYQKGDQYHIPARVVDQYLTAKFNTTAEPGAISCYDEQQDCYIIRPVGNYEGEILIDTLLPRGDGNYHVIAFKKDDPRHNLAAMEQTFEIEYDGDFRFVAFSQKERPFQQLNAEEEKIVDFINDYYYFDSTTSYDAATVLSYDFVFPYFSIFGFFDDEGAVYSYLQPHATGNSLDPYQIPAHFVDEFLTKKFNTKADPSLIESYDEQTDCYRIAPDAVDCQYFAELIEYSREGDIYTVTVNQRHWLQPEYRQQQQFQLEIKEDDCKYLAFSAEGM